MDGLFQCVIAVQCKMHALTPAQIDFLRRNPYHYNAWSQSLLDGGMQP